MTKEERIEAAKEIIEMADGLSKMLKQRPVSIIGVFKGEMGKRHELANTLGELSEMFGRIVKQQERERDEELDSGEDS